jgi:hypothetical protein
MGAVQNSKGEIIQLTLSQKGGACKVELSPLLNFGQ